MSERKPSSTQSGRQGRQDQSQAGGREKGGAEKKDDLKSREYRDEKGQVHHHTKKYMEQHGGEKERDDEE